VSHVSGTTDTRTRASCRTPTHRACAQEQRLLARLQARRGGGGVSLLEYGRAAWEFHAKGVWLLPPPSEGVSEPPPVATVVGSSNYGARSARRDVEAQATIVTRHAGLRRALAHEWDALAAHAPTVALPQLAARARRVGARLAAHAAARWM
jgi:CDP-diacylglycerol--glycerol-3-phosphate 3-phosphatidyltransferase